MKLSHKPRIESIDALRGMLACGIMLFHITMWTDLLQSGPVDNFWNWLGIYGVEMFFIISGFSMAYVYLGRPLNTKSGLLEFFWKRFMRLWPLYVTAYIIATVFRIISNDPDPLNPLDALLHISLLFGFIDPSIKGIIGGWSIGVEVVCYALFPFMIFLFRNHGTSWKMLTVLALFLIPPAIFEIAPDSLLANSWQIYVFPTNHLFLFAGGAFLAKMFLNKQPHSPSLIVRIVTGLVLIVTCFTPLTQTDTNVVTGWGRLIFIILSFAICWISIAQISTPKFLAPVLNPIGLWSYSIYLLHPFIFQGLKLINLDSQPLVHATLTLIGTLIMAKISYQFLEKPSVEWARKKAQIWFPSSPQTNSMSASSGK